MEHSSDHAAQPARDLPTPEQMARVLEEYDRRRSNLRVAELQLAQYDDLVIDGTIDYPLDLVREMLACKREVAAIAEVLAEMLGIAERQAVGSPPQTTPSPQVGILPVFSSKRASQRVTEGIE